MKKAAIPTLRSGDNEVDLFAAAVKQNLDAITAQARNVDRLEPLPSDAALPAIVARLNALLSRLQ